MSQSSLITLFRPGDQRINLPCRSGIQTRQNVFEPLAKADAVRFACRGERIQDSETLTTGLASGKETVLSDDRNSSIEALCRIVVDVQSGILQELFEFRFNVQRVRNGLRDR